MGPDFLVIGAQKSGTTWLHQNLQAHPEIWLPPEKELHFFDERISSELSLRDRVRGDDPEAERWRRQVRRQLKQLRGDRSRWRLTPWYARFFLGNGGVEWYRSLFRQAGDRHAGEVTPDYSIMGDEDVARVRAHFPDLRIVFLIRSPLERIWSHAQMQQRLLGRPAEEEVMHMVLSPRALLYGDYLATVDRWAHHFSPEQIWVGFMEDIAHHSRAVINAVTDHIGVERHDRYPQAGHSVHKGGQDTIPGPLAAQLADALGAQVQEQARQLGGHARWWAWATTALTTQPPDCDLVYPLWESVLADRCRQATNLDPAVYASGRLDTLTAAVQATPQE